MYIEQLYTGCLSEAAYFIESEGEAAVIDPIREPEPYLQLAASRGAAIRYIFETHFHADFVSGHLDLSLLTGGQIVFGPGAKPRYPVRIAEDDETFQLGKVSIRAVHTPGHTPESTCYLLIDESGKEHALFSGDTLFVGDVGRPDLAIKADSPISEEQLAGRMYDSLHQKILPLADDIILYPGHGAGSSCGKNLGPERSSTIGMQKKTNYALQPMSREEFIRAITDGLNPPPPYYFDDARINMQGYESITNVLDRNMKGLDIHEFEKQIAEGCLVLDTRVPDVFQKSFVPGSLNIGLNGSFAIWAGTLIPIHRALLIVAESGKEHESILRLARVGFENVKGYLEGGMESWTRSGKKTDSIRSVSPAEFSSHQPFIGHLVLDVRKDDEFFENRIKGAINISLDSLESRTAELPSEAPIFLYCRSGYRSMIAASLLMRAGFPQIINVAGGFQEIKKTTIPLERGGVLA